MIPGELGDLTPGWFSAVLGAEVTGAEVLDAHSGTTGRARVALSGANALPPTVFVKLAPFDDAQRRFIDAIGIGRMEARFYSSLAAEVPVRVPGVLHAELDGDGRYVMVLEDLVASGCRFPERAEADAPERARSTVAEMAKLHAAFWESPRFEGDGDLAWVPEKAGFGDLAGDPAAAEAAGWFVQVAVERYGAGMPEAFHRVADLYLRHTAAVLDLWDRGERTLLHGDGHIGNLFVDGERTGFYDWAMLSRSPALRDVSYFCCYSMSPAARRAQERDLLDHYLRGLAAAGGPQLDPVDAWRQYRAFAVYGWVSATSTAAMGTKWQREELSRGAMERATATVDDLDSVGALEELLG